MEVAAVSESKRAAEKDASRGLEVAATRAHLASCPHVRTMLLGSVARGLMFAGGRRSRALPAEVEEILEDLCDRSSRDSYYVWIGASKYS